MDEYRSAKMISFISFSEVCRKKSTTDGLLERLSERTIPKQISYGDESVNKFCRLSQLNDTRRHRANENSIGRAGEFGLQNAVSDSMRATKSAAAVSPSE
jgi:hypothetical protein